mmetsp:Transcript_47404/g.107443  ORF Transcript_47404/g.107443 Transcript_47404/m.107443 type:complete len:191 (+) Transcript_47404:103-675(+)|eukprot:CAMPEP_0172629552 /NCGR_PEP_ID=MMETSP1068-20121228/168537_1 /TAXON_ID=35684 /ORGANISM="Pseudopedinella elastica, Strain CCMP716" /LENGTH=190 /DNA_ID=CAMNT_0013440125 /DNA_START=45 /DNA_END=617 /DNA_ORIENTATION=-
MAAAEGDWKKLHSACRWGKYEEVESLLGPGNVDCADPGNGNRPIHIGAQNGHLNITKLLISNKCDVNAQNNGGQTALHMAMEYDYLAIVNALLEAGADEALVNEAGNSAISGIDGGKVLALVGLTVAVNESEHVQYLDELLGDTASQAKVDKVALVQIRMKHKKDPSVVQAGGWSDTVDGKFKQLLQALP